MEQALGTSTSTLSNQGSPYESLAAVLHHSRALTWRSPRPRFRIHSGARVSSSSSSGSKQPSPSIPQVAKQFKGLAERASTSVAPPYHQQANEILQVNKGTMFVISAAILGMAVLAALVKPKDRTGGSVEDLVKRGQLRSDRRSDSRPLKYEDPFNNPMVKVGERNTVVKMYGKAFRLQPVTLTEEKMLSHQNRRVQAYQWKRPTVFLVEGEPIPDGIDPDIVRWIPPNHPFATAKNDFDEVAAEKNVYQTRGVPSRVRAEHEALRKRMMDAAEKETELQFPVFDPMTNGERKRIEKPFQVLSDQPDNGLGSRPIKPFEKPDGDISAKVQENPSSPFNPNADYGQP